MRALRFCNFCIKKGVTALELVKVTFSASREWLAVTKKRPVPRLSLRCGR